MRILCCVRMFAASVNFQLAIEGAAEAVVRRLLLFGYQGKLIKLAGGIFHTHHHLADGRAEVLTALAALGGLDGAALQALHDAPTVEMALAELALRDGSRAQQLRQTLQLRLQELTERERDVMRCVIDGLPNKLIADQLDISVRTVEVHRARVFDKMQVKSAVELANLLRGEGG